MGEHMAEVELLGHKAKVSYIKGDLADGLLRKEDSLFVWLEFDEAVDSTLAFAIRLPVRSYSKDEFLKAVVVEGERELKERLARGVQEREAMRVREERKIRLDGIAKRIEAELRE